MRLRLSAAIASALLGLALAGANAGAQGTTGSVTGTVVDSATQRPLPQVRVSVLNVARDTYTRDDGSFTLTNVPAGPQRVRVAIIGYTPGERLVTVAAGQPTTVRFALTQAAVRLQEIVSVGYGEQRRSDVTGAVASVSANELATTVVTSLDQGLQGKVAGVQVTQGDAAPGAGIRVQVRGTNSMNPGSAQPLYVIDGVVVGGGISKRTYGATSEENLNSLTETNPLASIAPSDIESIDVLKDASATAIYGSRGANGVVIITTKKGQRGRGGEFSLNYAQGMQSVVKEIPVLNAYEFASYVNAAFVNAFGTGSRPYGDRPGSLTPDSIRKVQGAGVNWQDLIFQNAPLRDATLSFAGGDDNGSYLVSANVLDQDGVITGSEYRRGGLRLNLDRNVTSRLRISNNLAVTRSLNDMVRTSTINGYRAIGIVRQALTYVPFAWRDTTQADPRTENAETFNTYGANPLRYTDEVSENDQQSNALGGLRAVTTLGAGVSLDLNLSGYYNRRSYNTYYPRTVTEGRAASGLAVNSGNEYGNLVSDNLLRWAREYGDRHRFDAVGGFSTTYEKGSW
ncbi:MAG: carboxypeptidase-like regulatory domain-containing protein, partial [Gemmatimonadaceae bacterium]